MALTHTKKKNRVKILNILFFYQRKIFSFKTNEKNMVQRKNSFLYLAIIAFYTINIFFGKFVSLKFFNAEKGRLGKTQSRPFTKLVEFW